LAAECRISANLAPWPNQMIFKFTHAACGIDGVLLMGPSAQRSRILGQIASLVYRLAVALTRPFPGRFSGMFFLLCPMQGFPDFVRIPGISQVPPLCPHIVEFLQPNLTIFFHRDYPEK
jgi:hypothetical protein